MNPPSSLDAILGKAIRVDGKDLYALATLILSRTPFLRHVIRRQKTIRTDPRVSALGIGVDADAEAVLDKNLHLIAYLLREALRNGHEAEETYSTLAECLYDLGRYPAALAVVREAAEKAITSGPLNRIRAKTLLASDDPQAFEEFAAATGYSSADLQRVKIIDHRHFDEWARRVNAEIVTISDAPLSASGSYRFCTNEGMHEFDYTVTATALQGALKRNLTVYGGLLPFENHCGYYHEEARVTVGDSPLTIEVAQGAFAFDSAKARRVAFPGKHLIPCAPHRYFAQYSHGIVQIYSRLVAALQTGKFDDFGILLPESTPGWVTSLLASAGIDTARIRKMPLDAIAVVEEACVLPMKWDICPFEIQSLRKAVSQRHPYGGERINYYLTRKDVKNFHRAMVNEDEFIAICEKRGFTILDPLDYSLEEQIGLFSKAGIIVTSDSSGDTNMLYAPPGAEVILIIPGRFCGMLMADVAISCGHTVSVVIGEFLAGDRNVDHTSGPYKADPKLLADLLDSLTISTGSEPRTQVPSRSN